MDVVVSTLLSVSMLWLQPHTEWMRCVNSDVNLVFVCFCLRGCTWDGDKQVTYQLLCLLDLALDHLSIMSPR